jgi:lipoprotein-anchoring transpeptidase ErfK/SrfK
VRPRVRSLAIVLLGFLVGGAWLAVPTRAQEAATVTLAASATTVRYGETVTLSGTVTPPSAGETVVVADDAGVSVAEASTDASGAYTVEVTPERNVSLHAVWNDASSAAVDLKVRVQVKVALTGVRLFGRAQIHGTVVPAHPGARPTVRLLRAGSVLVERTPKMAEDGSFTIFLPIRLPGTYRARATFGDEDHLAASDASVARVTALPAIANGSAGPFVRLLEERLVALHYRLEGIDGRYDFRTGDAVVAFHKVQGMPRRFDVTAATWRALADPVVPRPRSKSPAFHLEIDQSRQVLYTVQDGAITNISHVSTGKSSTPTYDGWFTVYRKVTGTYHGLYYPSYFDGGRAIHGWVDVPTYPASHGCVRFPFWNAQWIYGMADMGTRILIYH